MEFLELKDGRDELLDCIGPALRDLNQTIAWLLIWNVLMFISLIALTIYSASSRAQLSDEIIGGSLTYHIFDPNSVSLKYSNKIDSTGMLISNPIIGYRQVTTVGIEYSTETVFTGTNSIAEPIVGMLWSSGLTSNNFRLGLAYGFYFQNNSLLLDKRIVPVMIIPYPGWGPTPVIGIEATKIINLSKDYYFMVNGLLTPILINATIGFGWKI